MPARYQCVPSSERQPTAISRQARKLRAASGASIYALTSDGGVLALRSPDPVCAIAPVDAVDLVGPSVRRDAEAATLRFGARMRFVAARRECLGLRLYHERNIASWRPAEVDWRAGATCRW